MDGKSISPMTTPSLDPSLLAKVRHHASGKVTARCPACGEGGGDRTGNHLVIFPDGRFACAAYPGDRDHRSRIHALAGVRAEVRMASRERREWRRQAAREQQRKQQAATITDAIRSHRQALVSRYAWHPSDVWEDSPQRLDDPLISHCPRHFLATLFPPDALLWTGEVHHSGQAAHASRWKTAADWQVTTDLIGPMTTPAIWQPGTCSRTATHVINAPFTVLDFDGFDGIKPATPAELHHHLHASLALIRWLRECFHWQLAAILHTGGKSLHAWFRTPPPEVLESLRHAADPLGIDRGLIGRPEHPCRLPGQLHRGSGNLSSVRWLQ